MNPVTCEFCGEEVNPTQVGTCYRVEGWVENRGSAGGANALLRKSPPTGWGHKACVVYSPIIDDQIALF